MNNKSMLRKLTLLTILLVVVSAFAAAQTTPQSGTINLSGTVPLILHIDVVDNGSATGLDLSSDIAKFQIGSVTEYSNNIGGYTVSVSSANALDSNGNPQFIGGASGNTDTLAYQFYWDSETTARDLSTNNLLIDATGKSSGTTKAVAISYTAPASPAYADSYSDTLTFTIAAK